MGSPRSSFASLATSSQAGPAMPLTCSSSFPVSGSVVNSISGIAPRRSEANLDLDHAALDRAASGAVQAARDRCDDALAVGHAELGQESSTVEHPLVVLADDGDVPVLRPGEAKVVRGRAEVATTHHELGRLRAAIPLVAIEGQRLSFFDLAVAEVGERGQEQLPIRETDLVEDEVLAHPVPPSRTPSAARPRRRARRAPRRWPGARVPTCAAPRSRPVSPRSSAGSSGRAATHRWWSARARRP